MQNVVTYIAIISANNERGELMPGMTANVRIVTDTRDSVLKVPNAALRFRPAGENAAAKSEAAKSDSPGKAMQGADAGASKGGAGGGGQLNQFRERIVTELKMDAEQQQQLDPIFAEMRNKFMGAARSARGGTRAAERGDSLRHARARRRNFEARAESALRRDHGRARRARRRRPDHARAHLPDGQRQAEARSKCASAYRTAR